MLCPSVSDGHSPRIAVSHEPLEIGPDARQGRAMLSDSEIRATDLGGRQSGYVTLRQAMACGMSAEAVRRRVEAKRWIRIRPGLFLIPGFQPSVRGRLLAATAALGAVVSHESAAELHCLPGTP